MFKFSGHLADSMHTTTFQTKKIRYRGLKREFDREFHNTMSLRVPSKFWYSGGQNISSHSALQMSPPYPHSFRSGSYYVKNHILHQFLTCPRLRPYLKSLTPCFMGATSFQIKKIRYREYRCIGIQGI